MGPSADHGGAPRFGAPMALTPCPQRLAPRGVVGSVPPMFCPFASIRAWRGMGREDQAERGPWMGAACGLDPQIRRPEQGGLPWA